MLDELPSGGWEFVSKSAMVIDIRYSGKVERVFREFSEHVVWRRFEVEV